MRTVLYFIGASLIVTLIVSCGSYDGYNGKKGVTSNEIIDTIRIANDSLEYEVIIIEPGFNSWLATQPPQGYRAQSSMDISNDQKIPIYNLRVNNPLRYGSELYPFRIDYDPRIDYGYEVTYLLYNYFLFFEQRYNQRL